MKANNQKKSSNKINDLNSLIKAARDKMRTDKGLSGETDRLPQLAWIMFLKFLDDMEKIHEAEVIVSGKFYVPLIDSPYRWRDWAKPGGLTGNELLSFINNEEAMRPDGTKGKGLFSYLRTLHGKDNNLLSRKIISNVFNGVSNSMRSGYLLRDVIEKVDKFNFTSSEEFNILGHIYESLLKELRDAAGDSGEYYTPRPVVKFMVKMINPVLGETVLDPASGTGGFLVESFRHIHNQCKTASDYELLQKKTIQGIEAKPLPYLLCMMNLLLHGMEFPYIDPLNALRFPLYEIGKRDRVDIIITNPPFGAAEEREILKNFPNDRQTEETALLFLQLVMKKLKRKDEEGKGGRCAIVLHNGVLFGGDRISQIIKKNLVNDFNLHTIIRLPRGVFAPYTDIATNLIFFEHGSKTENIWYYSLPLPDERKQYTKTFPLQFREFHPIIEWWNKREENDNAWKVPIEKIIQNNYNLDVPNPNNNKNSIEDASFENIVKELKLNEQKIINIICEIENITKFNE